MRMEWIRRNSVGKQALVTEKIFGRKFRVVSFTESLYYLSFGPNQSDFESLNMNFNKFSYKGTI